MTNLSIIDLLNESDKLSVKNPSFYPSITLDADDNFFKRVYEIVKKIPVGKVASYGCIAKAVGNKKMARQVGWALHANPSPDTVPCYRVVFADGKLSEAFAFGGINAQRKLLNDDGISFDKNGRVCDYCFCTVQELI